MGARGHKLGQKNCTFTLHVLVYFCMSFTIVIFANIFFARAARQGVFWSLNENSEKII